jgi:hypothetical protein
MTHSIILVRFQVPGFHNWPGAVNHPGREYLASLHRHLFHVEVRMTVTHDDREVEFHDLLDTAKRLFPGGEMGASSCEHMARKLGKEIARLFGRAVEVSVSEDGEVGALVVTPRPDHAAHG